jgi:xylulokinase
MDVPLAYRQQEGDMYVIGLDVGTQGARALVCGADGSILASASQTFSLPTKAVVSETGSLVQDPGDWWTAAAACVRIVISDLRNLGISPAEIRGVAVDSTSGTIIATDASGNPLAPAIMYNDVRSVAEAEECNAAGSALTEKLGYRFSASFGLPKILWLKKHEPKLFDAASCFIHAADYIVGRLTGNFRISDSSSAMKTGYDLIEKRWPEFIESSLGIPIDKLPKVVPPGEIIGEVSEECSRETGLAAGTKVIAGVTDGTAGFLASGAAKVGDWNSTIGTTMVLRGISSDLIKDPKGRVYCHSHPQGYWLPGGASNSGAECLSKLFHGKNLDELGAYVPVYSPTSLLVYPLIRKGERFPFSDPNAEGFIVGEPRDSRDLFTAYLEGIAFVERWSFEVLQSLGAFVGDSVYTTGGGAKSTEWMQIRATVLNRRVIRPQWFECAIGTAAVAASSTIFSGLDEAVRGMVKTGESVDPDPSKSAAYEHKYVAFRDACTARGYV